MDDYVFSINNITYEEFVAFIADVDSEFIPTLTCRLNILNYYEKLSRYACGIICRYNNTPVGINYFYCNDDINRLAYITLVAVRKQHRGNNIASGMIERSVKLAGCNGMKIISVHTNSETARGCYIKNGFEQKSVDFLKEYNLNRYYLERKI